MNGWRRFVLAAAGGDPASLAVLMAALYRLVVDLLERRLWSSHSSFRGSPIATVSRLGSKVAISVSDQTLFSGANATLSMALARWMSVEEYGVFCLGLTVYLIAASFHSGLILDPVNVLGPSYCVGDTRVYLRNVFFGQLGLSLVLGVVLVALAITVPIGAGPKTALMGAAILSPTMLTVWYLRSVHYLLGNPRQAAMVSARYAIALIVLFGVVVREQEKLSAISGFSMMAAAAAIACAPCFRLAMVGGDEPSLLTVVRTHWGFGKWFVAAPFLAVGTSHIQVLVVANCLGMAGAGALRAAMNFALPLVHLVTAISHVALPSLARTYNERPNHLKVAARRLLFSYASGGFVYAFALSVFGPRLDTLAYGSKFSVDAGLFPILGVWVFAVCVSNAAGVVLRAGRDPKACFVSLLAASAFGFVTSRPLIQSYGLSGAALSMAGTYIVSAIVQLAAYRRISRSLTVVSFPKNAPA